MSTHVNAPHNETHTFYPATEKQIKFLQDLFATRDLDPKVKARGLAKLAAGMDKKMASDSITYLLTKPKVTETVEAPKAKVVQGDGFYMGGSGTIYSSLTKKDHKFPTWKRLLGTKYLWTSWKVAKSDVESGGHRMTEDEIAAHGKKIGYCVCCGRTLSNPESVQAGIGPVCAGKYGSIFA